MKRKVKVFKPCIDCGDNTKMQHGGSTDQTDVASKGTKGKCTGVNFGGPDCPQGSPQYSLAQAFRKASKQNAKKITGSVAEQNQNIDEVTSLRKDLFVDTVASNAKAAITEEAFIEEAQSFREPEMGIPQANFGNMGSYGFNEQSSDLDMYANQFAMQRDKNANAFGNFGEALTNMTDLEYVKSKLTDEGKAYYKQQETMGIKQFGGEDLPKAANGMEVSLKDLVEKNKLAADSPAKVAAKKNYAKLESKLAAEKSAWDARNAEYMSLARAQKAIPDYKLKKHYAEEADFAKRTEHLPYYADPANYKEQSTRVSGVSFGEPTYVASANDAAITKYLEAAPEASVQEPKVIIPAPATDETSPGIEESSLDKVTAISKGKKPATQNGQPPVNSADPTVDIDPTVDARRRGNSKYVGSEGTPIASDATGYANPNTGHTYDAKLRTFGKKQPFNMNPVTQIDVNTRRAILPGNRIKNVSFKTGIPQGQYDQVMNVPDGNVENMEHVPTSSDRLRRRGSKFPTSEEMQVSPEQFNAVDDWNYSPEELEQKRLNAIEGSDYIENPNAPRVAQFGNMGQPEGNVNLAEHKLKTNWAGIGSQLAGPGMNALAAIGRKRSQPDWQQEMERRTSADQMFSPNEDFDRGMNTFNQMGTPDPYGSKMAPQFTGMMKEGGQYFGDGGTYDTWYTPGKPGATATTQFPPQTTTGANNLISHEDRGRTLLTGVETTPNLTSSLTKTTQQAPTPATWGSEQSYTAKLNLEKEGRPTGQTWSQDDRWMNTGAGPQGFAPADTETYDPNTANMYGDMENPQIKASFMQSGRAIGKQNGKDIFLNAEGTPTFINPNMKKLGGDIQYTEGGEYDLTEEEIQHLLQNGGEIEFV